VNVVDSSGWLEYFVNGPGADHFAPAIEDLDALLVPGSACSRLREWCFGSVESMLLSRRWL
jgi:hypothetical protein